MGQNLSHPETSRAPDGEPAYDLAGDFERHRFRLMNLLRYRLHSRIGGRLDLDDLLQDIFVAANQRNQLNQGPQPGYEYLWLRMIALQTLQNTLRYHQAEKRNVNREFSVLSPPAIEDFDFEFIASITSPSQRVARQELYQQAEMALKSLSQQDQEIIILRHFEELGNSEAASVLNIEPKAASIRYIRAIDRLKRAIDQKSSRPVSAPRTALPGQ